MTDLKYYSFIYLHAYPKYALSFEGEVKKYVEFLKKHGANICGAYNVIIGGTDECVLLIEYENFEEKLQIKKALLADEEYKEFYNKFSRIMCRICDYVTKTAIMYPFTPPDAKSIISIRKYDVKGELSAAVQDFAECNDIIYKKEFLSRGVNIVGLFQPLYGEQTNCYFVVVEVTTPNPFTVGEEIARSVMISKLLDHSLKELGLRVWDHVVNGSAKLYTPI